MTVTSLMDNLRGLFSRYLDEPGNEASPRALEIAVTLLMLEIARADFDTDGRERTQIVQALGTTFGFSDAEAREVLALAEQREADATSLHPALRRINDAFSPEQKYAVIESLWRVAYADGRLDKYEEYHVRKIADLLYVPHSAFIRAKCVVEAETQGTGEDCAGEENENGPLQVSPAAGRSE
ncbi:MAG: TerB family tellurite resistance protein [Gammaproteobacteria bacterium]|jgi:uncharacterized tellurite resistance protein B-like protein